MSTILDSAHVADLAGQVSGSVLAPQDAGYEAARAVHNGLVDRRPALIVRCRTACDVAGGHNVAGRAVTDGGVMIDLAEMKGIAIDPDQQPLRPRGA